jgi:hypothetical protein
VKNAIIFIQVWREKERENEEARVRQKMERRRRLGRVNTVGDALRLRDYNDGGGEEEDGSGRRETIPPPVPSELFGDVLEYYYGKESDEEAIKKARV